MSKYTPGPWMIGNIQGVDMVIENHDGFEVCTVWEDPEQHDAQLIAAAPDMLAELFRIKDLSLREFGISVVDERILSKATGETK
jgi:hypothetical protein